MVGADAGSKLEGTNPRRQELDETRFLALIMESDRGSDDWSPLARRVRSPLGLTAVVTLLGLVYGLADAMRAAASGRRPFGRPRRDGAGSRRGPDRADGLRHGRRASPAVGRQHPRGVPRDRGPVAMWRYPRDARTSHHRIPARASSNAGQLRLQCPRRAERRRVMVTLSDNGCCAPRSSVPIGAGHRRGAPASARTACRRSPGRSADCAWRWVCIGLKLWAR